MVILERSIIEPDANVRIETGKLLRKFLETFEMQRNECAKCRKLILFIIERLKDVESNVKLVFFECFALLDPFVLLIFSQSDGPKALEYSHDFIVTLID
jgi:hypothetical protein